MKQAVISKWSFIIRHPKIYAAFFAGAFGLGSFLWLYSDQFLHLYSKFINVNKLAQTTISRCRNPQQVKELCYGKEMEKFAFKLGPGVAFGVLAVLSKLDLNEYSCHFAAHGIGRGVYRKDPENWRKNAIELDSACVYGAFHGILEAYNADTGRDILSSDVITLCSEDLSIDCGHGLGHVVVVQNVGKLDDSLFDCDRVDNVQIRNRCYSGALMEYLTGYMLVGHGIVDAGYLQWDKKMDQFEALCQSLSGERQLQCWTEIIHPAIVVWAPEKVFALCFSAGKQELAYACVDHAIWMLMRSYDFDLARAKDMCIPMDQDLSFEDRCFQGVAIAGLSEKPSDSVRLYCGTIPLRYQKTCFELVEKNL